MFTGLVQAIGRVEAVGGSGGVVRLEVDAGRWMYAAKARAGDSVAVAGVCLTLVEKAVRNAKTGRILRFDVVQETLDKTTLGGLRRGASVNLEHAATASTFMGGHIVQGHVDGVGRVAKVQRGDDWRVWIDLPPKSGLARYLVAKGSVCVDGVSLTVAGLTKKGFWVALIPSTLAETTLRDLETGDGVNLEMDIIAKMVAAQLKPLRSGRKRE